MTMKLRVRFAIAFVVFATILGAAPSSARATEVSGYVCKSSWVVNAGGLASFLKNTGSEGVVYTYLFSAPRCGGSQVAMAYFCTRGATNTTYCALDQLLSEAQAANLSANLQQAGASAQKITINIVSGNIGSYVEFTEP
jgi:hypothetical protein